MSKHGWAEAVPEVVVRCWNATEGRWRAPEWLLYGIAAKPCCCDGRHDRKDVVPLLREAGVETISLLVGTHPHGDHIGQFGQVIGAFPVEDVWMSGDSHTSRTFERAIDAIGNSDAGYHEPRAGETFNIGSARVEVVQPLVFQPFTVVISATIASF